jgi:hypothetical protein
VTRLAAALPVDGDGDGRVFDGTKREMPAPRVPLAKKLGGALDRATTAGKSRKVRRRKGTLGPVGANAKRSQVNKQSVVVADKADFNALSEPMRHRAAGRISGTSDSKQGPVAGFGHYGDDDEAIIAHMVANLEAQQELAESRPGFIARNKTWYDSAQGMAADMADEYHVDPDAVAGVIAILSANTSLSNNIADARGVLAFHAGGDAVVNTPEVKELAKELAVKLKVSLVDVPLDAKLNDVADPETRAVYARAWDVARNDLEPRSPDMYVDDNGKLVESATESTRRKFQSVANMVKALALLDDPTPENLSAQLGDGLKIRSFYNNIAYPDDPADDVTIDVHASSSLLGVPYGTKDKQVAAIIGTKSTQGQVVKLLMIEAFRRFTENHPDTYTHPREAQSVLWEQWRAVTDTDGEPGAKKWSEARRAAIADAWAAADDPSLTQVQQQAAVDRARGMMMDWMRKRVTGEWQAEATR